MLKSMLAAGFLGSAALLAAAPLAAQEAATGATGSSDRIAEIIVYGTDPCPRSTDDEVVVCARKPEAERYRIPERLRSGGALQSRQAWANRARSFEIATRRGVATCDAVGGSGQLGCLQKAIDQARAEQREAAADTPTP
ncbi:MAG: hypothetical protein AVDCRST_MAG31-397 [uncultured Sphingomonas sp.]|uniref:Uncharacterized protein n=1 Tax=uncultured Sphingomonas sp. TaxID=158754 RepID=A0A6J4SJX0_9SPHN|nr:hypothetical protein [uncultured Sphingomonas sp.]CAA9501133.1 MAG: hypothetical protein AVDCRST_MAG31-397 [uncultured Sphingomonas sp.]